MFCITGCQRASLSSSLADMKTKRLLVLAGVGIAAFFLILVWSASKSDEREQTLANAQKLLSALRSFVHDKGSDGRPLPAEIGLKELLRDGYLSMSDVRAFKGMPVKLATNTDDTKPQMILVRVGLPDGHWVCALADGSVQFFSEARLREQMKACGQQVARANDR